jgi:hypothetical protein
MSLKQTSGETNQSLAGGLWEVQKRLDKVAGNPVVIGTAGMGGQGFGAQYQAMKDPPIVEKTATYSKIGTSYAGQLGQNVTLPRAMVTIPFDKSDMDAWQEKEKMNLQFKFDEWISATYDPFTDPAEAEWLQKMYPEYFEARIKENEALHDLQKQWAKIQISGPKSKEDLYLMWRVSQDSYMEQRLTGNPGPTNATRQEYLPGFINRGKWGWRKPTSAINPNFAQVPHATATRIYYPHNNAARERARAAAQAEAAAPPQREVV